MVLFVLAFVKNIDAQDKLWNEFEHLFEPVKNYVVYKTEEPVKIDGLTNEPDWQKVPWITDFEDIEGTSKPKPLYSTRMKLLWDENNIYFFVELEEPHIWATYANHDQIVYHENDFEIFIDKEGDTHNYFEFEFNALNTLFDLYMPKAYRNGGVPLITWDSPGIKSAVQIHGSLNDGNDEDFGWTLEIALPFSDVRKGVPTNAPRNGEIWKMNFSRVQWQTEFVNGKYQKKINPQTGKPFHENNWVWSPQGLVNMHYPERWGNVQFSDAPAGKEKVEFVQEKNHELRNYLWLVYYKQKKHFSEVGKYAVHLDELEIPSAFVLDDKMVQLELFASSHQFVATVALGNQKVFRINNEGYIIDVR